MKVSISYFLKGYGVVLYLYCGACKSKILRKFRIKEKVLQSEILWKKFFGLFAAVLHTKLFGFGIVKQQWHKRARLYKVYWSNAVKSNNYQWIVLVWHIYFLANMACCNYSISYLGTIYEKCQNELFNLAIIISKSYCKYDISIIWWV